MNWKYHKYPGFPVGIHGREVLCALRGHLWLQHGSSGSEDWQFDMMEFDGEDHGSDRLEKTSSENGITTETHAPDTQEDHKPCQDNEAPQKSWSLDRNWGFSLEELFRLALKFFKGTELLMNNVTFLFCLSNNLTTIFLLSRHITLLLVAKQNWSPFLWLVVEIHCNNISTFSGTGNIIIIMIQSLSQMLSFFHDDCS